MSAIPEQTVAGYEQTLTRVCELAPEHISSYSLILEEGTPFYEKYGECPPVSEEEDRQMYELTKERLLGITAMRYPIMPKQEKSVITTKNTGNVFLILDLD